MGNIVFSWFSDNIILYILHLKSFSKGLPTFCLGHQNAWLDKNKQTNIALGDKLEKAENTPLLDLHPDFVTEFIPRKFGSGH